MLPLLPHDVNHIQNAVQKVPAGVCDAFFAALNAAIKACTTANAETSIKSAGEQLAFIESDPQYTDMPLSKIVFLQASILMVIATENMGPSSIKSTKRNQWMSFAIETASSLKLHVSERTTDAVNDPINDPYVRGDLGRRAWLILFILDRWHALGTSDVLHVDEDTCTLVDHDRSILGENSYQMFRKSHSQLLAYSQTSDNQFLGLSRAVGHLVKGFMFRKDPALPSSQGGIFGTIMDNEIESFREGTYLSFGRMPAVHLAYLHVRQIADRYLDYHRTQGAAIINSSFEIVSLLRHNKGIYCSPWLHHITGLAAITLEYVTDPQLHSSAIAALHDLREGLNASLFRAHREKTAWDIAISVSITKRLDTSPQALGTDNVSDHGGLGQLADAAMGKSESATNTTEGGTTRDAHRTTDWTLMTRKGYLNGI